MRAHLFIGAMAITVIAAACSGDVATPPAPTTAPVAATATDGGRPATSLVPVPPTVSATVAPLTTPASDDVPTAAATWPAGSVTCGELEGEVPVGVDDSGADLMTGLVRFSWGDGESGTIQFLDDPTCTMESDAWRFLLRQNLDADLLYRTGVLCDAVAALESASPAPANLATMLAVFDRAEHLCR